MTKKEIEIFKEFIELRAKIEPYNKKIIQIMQKAVNELTEKDKKIEELKKENQQLVNTIASFMTGEEE